MATVGDVLIAPLTPINPWFYWGLYESTQDDTTSDYVGDHLVAMSGWIFASAVHAYRTGKVITPFAAMTDGLQIMRYVAQDAGVFGKLGKVAVPLMIADIAHQTYSDPTDNPLTRGYEASPVSLLFGDHLFQQHGFRGGMAQGFENLKKNFHLA